MRTSESIVNIAKALAAAQGEIKNPECNEEVKVYAKKESGGGLLYTYWYATLPKCYDAARVPFQKNGLSHASGIAINEKSQAELVVRITHESGEWFESSVPLSGGSDAKAKAGEITFWKRYLFNGLAGIAGDDDPKDANGERGPGIPEDDGKKKPQGGKSSSPPPAQKTAQNEQKNASRPAQAAQTVAKNTTPAPDLTPFDKADAPPLKRPRGVIVKEIMGAAKALDLGKNSNPPVDDMTALEKLGGDMFGKPLEKTSDDDLEKMLAKLQQEMVGK